MLRRNMLRSLVRAATLLFVVAAFPLPAARADEPLHQRIDQLVEEANFGFVSPQAGDEEFLRRVYLDLTGTIPSSSEVRAFLEDSSSDKREKVIDRLLDSPRYARHMANVFDVMLLERRGGKHVKQEAWEKYLFDSFVQNKPWDRLAREILAADGTDRQVERKEAEGEIPKIRSAAKFYLAREAEPNVLTRDVGRIFFGRDLQCAQCHDHPLIFSYLQEDYYGIFAFLDRGFLFTDKEEKKAYYAEKADGDVTYTSVFTEETGATRPRLPSGLEIAEPVFPQGAEYLVEPDDEVRPVPKYSRREKLAQLAASGDNEPFNRNIVNRLWSHMMGRGLVEPVDLMDADDPPAHPKLLDLLADRFVEMNFDIQAMLHELALTKTYQQSMQVPDQLAAQASAAESQLAELEANYEARKEKRTQIRKKVAAAREAFDKAQSELDGSVDQYGKASAAVAEAQKKSDEASKKLDEAQQELAAKEDVTGAVRQAAEKAREAASKLDDDAELADAAATFQTRADALADEVAAARKTLEKLTPPAEKAEQALSEAREKAQATEQRVEEAKAQIAETRRPLEELTRQFQAATVAAEDAGQRLDHAEAVVQYAELSAQADAAEEALQAKREELAANGDKLHATEADLSRLEAERDTLQSEHEEAVARLEEARAKLADQTELADKVAEAAVKAEVASEKLSEDAEVKEAAQNVAARSEKLNAEVTQLRQAVEQHEQTAGEKKQQRAAVREKLSDSKQQLTTLQKKTPQLQAQVTELEEEAEQSRGELKEAEGEWIDRWENQFFTRALEPLSPEEMAWSVMQATGLVAQQEAAAQKKLDKELPLDPEKPDDPEQMAERRRAKEQFLYDKLNGNVGTFVKLFGHAAGQPQGDFFATIDQALFFSNAGNLQGWLKPRGENLTARLNKLEDPQDIAEELYLGVLSRKPTEDEVAEVTEYLAEREEERTAALQEMAWALIASAEFRFSR